VSQKTYERYESIVRVHLSPALGRIRLKVLTPGHVRGLYREKLDAELAPRTVLHVHRTLSKALKQATDDGLIPRNVAAPVKPPRPRSEEMQPLSRDQVQMFLDTVRGDRMEALYVLAVTTGLRQGELLALKWEDVGLEGANPALEVRRSLSETRGRRSSVTPKSGHGRYLRLSRRAVSALRAHRKRQLEERVRKAGLWEDHCLVFPSEVGTPHEWAQPLQGVQDTRQARLPAADTPLPRPAAYVCHATAKAGRKSQVRPRSLRPRRHKPHPEHLLPRLARHGRRRGWRDGRRVRVAPVAVRLQ
jgi:integrase